VASPEVASHGFTLTAAANVAFLELAWTPRQAGPGRGPAAPDRPTPAVTTWYLLARGDRRAHRQPARGQASRGRLAHRRRRRPQHHTHQQPDLWLRHSPIGVGAHLTRTPRRL